jgi:hypothetical protein
MNVIRTSPPEIIQKENKRITQKKIDNKSECLNKKKNKNFLLSKRSYDQLYPENDYSNDFKIRKFKKKSVKFNANGLNNDLKKFKDYLQKLKNLYKVKNVLFGNSTKHEHLNINFDFRDKNECLSIQQNENEILKKLNEENSTLKDPLLSPSNGKASKFSNAKILNKSTEDISKFNSNKKTANKSLNSKSNKSKKIKFDNFSKSIFDENFLFNENTLFDNSSNLLNLNHISYFETSKNGNQSIPASILDLNVVKNQNIKSLYQSKLNDSKLSVKSL